ncbi:cob(I)yrinic acid a,c-diamide adenosyltransferase [Candidatus Saccharibacteria bacterium]|jgi:cob(I)alamin adenosyltransferase|nr:MAG: cob(I)yrinic acid a,c-diamide adenosyltransferase [Candidatus Saccharibacteria bacterium]
MAFEDFKTKQSVVVVYTGEGKGKTSASVGLCVRALGAGWRVAYIQFIKHWEVSEHKFFAKIAPLYADDFMFYKGGKGFYNAGDLSAKDVSAKEHKLAAEETFRVSLEAATSGKYDIVICDEINNAVNDKLLKLARIEELIKSRAPQTSLCLTGRNFPTKLLALTDIATNMTKLKHHFDDKFLANKGIDY